jgi:hypothetical protein
MRVVSCLRSARKIRKIIIAVSHLPNELPKRCMLKTSRTLCGIESLFKTIVSKFLLSACVILVISVISLKVVERWVELMSVVVFVSMVYPVYTTQP